MPQLDFSADEALYSQDLDVRGYAGKWKAAKEHVVQCCELAPQVDGILYWLKVREVFLAFGGEYLDGTRC